MFPVYTSNIPNFIKTRLTQAVSNIYLQLTFNKMTHNAFHRNKKKYIIFVWAQFTLLIWRLEMIDYVRGPFNHNILLGVIKGDTCIV